MQNPPSPLDHAPLALVLLVVGVIGTVFEAMKPTVHTGRLIAFVALILAGTVAALIAYRTRMRVRRLVCHWFTPREDDRERRSGSR